MGTAVQTTPTGQQSSRLSAPLEATLPSGLRPPAGHNFVGSKAALEAGVSRLRLELSRNLVDFRSLKPKQRLIEEVAQRVVSVGPDAAPGAVYIPNLRDVLGTKARACKFAAKLMEALGVWLLAHAPESLNTTTAAGPPSSAIDFTPSYTTSSLAFNGIKRPHFDWLDRAYIAMLYGPNRNVSGGLPTLTDLNALQQAQGSSELDRFLTFYTLGTGEYKANAIALENSLEAVEEDLSATFAKLQTRWFRVAADHQVVIRDINFSQFPLIVLSNRICDGMMHGATKVRRKSSGFRAMSRPLRWYGIGAEA